MGEEGRRFIRRPYGSLCQAQHGIEPEGAFETVQQGLLHSPGFMVLQPAIIPSSDFEGSAVKTARWGWFPNARGLALNRRRSSRSSVTPGATEMRFASVLGEAVGMPRSSRSSVTPDILGIRLALPRGESSGSLAEAAAAVMRSAATVRMDCTVFMLDRSLFDRRLIPPLTIAYPAAREIPQLSWKFFRGLEHHDELPVRTGEHLPITPHRQTGLGGDFYDGITRSVEPCAKIRYRASR